MNKNRIKGGTGVHIEVLARQRFVSISTVRSWAKQEGWPVKVMGRASGQPKMALRNVDAKAFHAYADKKGRARA